LSAPAIKRTLDVKYQGNIVVPRFFLILILAIGLGACASTASDPSAAQNDAASSADASEKPKKRCYREKETGTRLGKRVCVTVAD
jgi:hypothetical protein